MGEQATAVAEGRIRSLSEAEWLRRSDEHERAMGAWIDAYRDRRARRESHPVHDFLFTYYQTKRRALRQWRPAWNEALQGAAAERFLSDERYRRSEAGVRLDLNRVDEGSRRRLEWIAGLLRAAFRRPPRFNCFGLHEWAMVYKAEEVRHERTPLRLSPREIERVVEGSAIRCSHFDAFRFFTPAAAPLNELQPQQEGKAEQEQFGCVHFNMDLYRWCGKASPWVGADLLRACFELALRARELDMRASPYDLSGYGYEAIPIETQAGRERYCREQQGLYEAGQPLARRLLAECEAALSGGGPERP